MEESTEEKEEATQVQEMGEDRVENPAYEQRLEEFMRERGK
jgi:hypothetical protein